MTNHEIPSIFLGVSIFFLTLRVVTGKKRDFIFSVLFIVIAIGIFTFQADISVMYYFFAAIVVSFIGDLLMAQWIRLSEHRTIDGIMAFGTAHIIYIFAFYQLNIGFQYFAFPNWIFIILCMIAGFFIFNLVGTNQDLHYAIKISNGIYAIIITGLLIVVVSYTFTPFIPLITRFTAGIGVLLFIISDSILAYNEFQKEIPNAKLIIAITYILAQILLQLTPILTFIQ